MSLFPIGHASHPDWREAVHSVVRQLFMQMEQPGHAGRPRLGLIYASHAYARHAQDMLMLLAQSLPRVTDWVGCTASGVLAMAHEYTDAPGLAVMLLDVPAAHYRVYSGIAPLAMGGGEAGFEADAALVHSDAGQPELAELLQELSERTQTGHLFGALGGQQGEGVQFACRAEDLPLLRTGGAVGVFRGGFSGVAFASEVPCISRMAHGCAPLGEGLEITETSGSVLLSLRGQPALPQLLQLLDVQASPDQGGGWQAALGALRNTQAAIAPLGHGLERGALTPEAQVLNLVGLDPLRQGVALSSPVEAGHTVIFCQRQEHAARHELMQMGAALQDALLPDFADGAGAAGGEPAAPQIRGAIYVSCKGRGSELFGAPDTELRILRHALGSVPLIGLMGEAEIMDARLHHLAGVLTVFTEPATAN